MKPCIRNIFFIVLVINFLLLVIALTDFIPDNPLKEYSVVLVISFVVIAGFARHKCNKGRQAEES